MKAVHVISLDGTARGLAGAWQSKVLARIGDARVKVLRMDGSAYPEEQHDDAEALLVLDGELRLVIGGREQPVRTGEVVVVPSGIGHSVGAGSHGILLIVDVADDGRPTRATAALPALTPSPAAPCP